MAHNILIVDDEADIRMLTAGILEDEGYATRQAANSTEALAAIESRNPDLILLDIWLIGSEMDGLGILNAVQERFPEIPVVIMSGHGTIETAVSAIKNGAYDFIEKPFETDRLLLILTRAIEAARLKRENLELRLKFGPGSELIGDSAPMAQIRQAIKRVAGTRSRVLITGPAGSGKEVVARMIHAQSPRAEGPFVVVNCATMDPDKVDIELFGTELDTSGTLRKIGTFEHADEGTLFLDEVADMPLETQGRIVRVLQEQTFSRVGGTERIRVDVRVIAASNRDLNQAMQEGRFREDLFYRLSVVPLTTPSLRECIDDIPVLADHFIRQAADAGGMLPRAFGDDALAALQTYTWPGNVRELRNVVERVLIMAPGDASEPIRADMLPAEVTGLKGDTASTGLSAQIMGLPLRDAREAFEREYLLAQKTRFGGNISKTASFVGMERSALHRKLKSLGIDQE